MPTALLLPESLTLWEVRALRWCGVRYRRIPSDAARRRAASALRRRSPSGWPHTEQRPGLSFLLAEHGGFDLDALDDPVGNALRSSDGDVSASRIGCPAPTSLNTAHDVSVLENQRVPTQGTGTLLQLLPHNFITVCSVIVRAENSDCLVPRRRRLPRVEDSYPGCGPPLARNAVGVFGDHTNAGRRRDAPGQRDSEDESPASHARRTKHTQGLAARPSPGLLPLGPLEASRLEKDPLQLKPLPVSRDQPVSSVHD